LTEAMTDSVGSGETNEQVRDLKVIVVLGVGK
jgi:hypothetical protein